MCCIYLKKRLNEKNTEGLTLQDGKKEDKEVNKSPLKIYLGSFTF